MTAVAPVAPVGDSALKVLVTIGRSLRIISCPCTFRSEHFPKVGSGTMRLGNTGWSPWIDIPRCPYVPDPSSEADTFFTHDTMISSPGILKLGQGLRPARVEGFFAS